MTNFPEYLHFSEDLEKTIEIVKERFASSNYAVLVDENTKEHCYPKISSLLPPHQVIQISSGEIHKNLRTCEYIWKAMTELELERKSVLINLGGGVIGDMGGFCARTFKRGISFVNIPTSLLAQVDASIGGKLGIDFHRYKNHIGLFSEPDMVIIHTPMLDTLPEREFRSGFAEIIKHNLIADAEHWKYISSIPDWKNSVTIDEVKHSVGIKSEVVEMDPLENGYRKVLNYGHTAGHAIESYYLESDRPVLHGEAIAAGMIIENEISVRKGMLDKRDHERIQDYILGIYGKIGILASEEADIIDLTVHDKKNMQGEIRASLLERPGKAVWDVGISGEEIAIALGSYRQL